MSIRFVCASPVATVDLPSPSINNSGRAVTNQTLQRSAAGGVFTFDHGPERYQQDLSFDALTEQEHHDLFAFFETIRWSANEFEYELRDPRDGIIKTMAVRMIGPPPTRRRSLNNQDVTIRLESSHPFNYEHAT